MPGKRPQRESCLSSPRSSTGESSAESQDDSPNTSRAPSSRGSRSFNAWTPSHSQRPSPPVGWISKPGAWSPSRSAPDLREKRTGGEAPSGPYWPYPSGPAAAVGPTRKSPFRLTSADSVGSQNQFRYQNQPQPMQLSTTGAVTGAGESQRRYSSTRSGGRVSSWWLVPVVVLGACAGLLLLAVAALGTTYTYRSVIARIAAAERAASQHLADLGNRSAFMTEDDGQAMALLPGIPEYSDDRDDVADDGANGPRPRLWCFLRRLDPSPSPAGGTAARASAAPRGLCSALVYQGVRVLWRDAQASIDVVQPSNEDDLRRLAARRDVDPLLEVYVHVASDQPPMSEFHPDSTAAGPGTTSPSPKETASTSSTASAATTKEALRSLLRSPQGTTEVFAMRTARWLVVHHLDGLVVELGSAVSGVATEHITRLAEICQRQLGRMGKSFTLVLPESTTLFAQYDLDALLTTRGLYPIQRTHLTSDLRHASCPAPYKGAPFAIEHILNRTRSALGARRRRQGLSRLFFSVSLMGAHFLLDREPVPNVSATFAAAKFQGLMPYAQVCRLLMSDGWSAHANLETDCTEATRGIQWVSAFAPFSGDWIIGLKGKIRGLAVFDVEGDDRDGYCGEKHVLLRRLRDLLA
ncbi:uncharacterized protein LOC144129490 [Amblyomma americanum]